VKQLKLTVKDIMMKELAENEDLMTVAEIAEAKGTSERTIRRMIAEVDIDPEELKINQQGGRPTPYYKLSILDAALSDFKDSKLIEQTSDKTKVKFLIGHVELEGTEEQKKAIRAWIDQKDQQIGQLHHALLEEKNYNEDVWCNARAEVNQLVIEHRKDDVIAYEALLKDYMRLCVELNVDPITRKKIRQADIEEFKKKWQELNGR
jgi:predicted transcriptional regulator